MSIVLNMPAELGIRLRNAAAHQGVPEEECVLRLLEQHLPASDRRAAAQAWHTQWSAMVASLSEEELAANRRFLQEFDENRTSDRKLFAKAVQDDPQ